MPRYLHLDELDCSVAIIKNVRSGRMGKKDIIKIDSPMEVDLDVLGYIDSNITVNVIRNGQLVAKKHLQLPQKLVNIIHCKNPRGGIGAASRTIFLSLERIEHPTRDAGTPCGGLCHCRQKLCRGWSGRGRT